MEPMDWSERITAIHASAMQIVLAMTGGGATAIGRLLEVPGGSRTVLEAVVPYSLASLQQWVGADVEQACSEGTARDMAMAAWMRSRELKPEADPAKLVGVGVTASLASDRPKRGDHRVHVAIQTASSTSCDSLVLQKDSRVRGAEEQLVADLVLSLLGRTVAHESSPGWLESLPLLEGEAIESKHQRAEPIWTELLLGQREHLGMTEKPGGVFAGSFDPPHAGHARMIEFARDRLGSAVYYELSMTNVDKAPLDFIEIDHRMSAIRGLDKDAQILLTNAPTFRKKAELFAGSTFLVGADTMARIGDPKYYERYNSEGVSGLEAAIKQIADHGCRFLVFGREIEGKFTTLRDLKIPESLQEISDAVQATDFREDISSTEIRQRQT